MMYNYQGKLTRSIGTGRVKYQLATHKNELKINVNLNKHPALVYLCKNTYGLEKTKYLPTFGVITVFLLLLGVFV